MAVDLSFFDDWIDEFSSDEFETDLQATESEHKFPFAADMEISDAVLGGLSVIPIFGKKGKKREAFSNPKTARDALIDIREIYGIVNEYLTSTSEDVMGQITRELVEDREPHDVETMMLRYLVTGKCYTRLGVEIRRPAELSPDQYLDTALGLVQIVFEDYFNHQKGLAWVANPQFDDKGQPASDEDLQKLRHQEWGQLAAEFAQYSGGALGATMASVAQTAVSPLATIPDDVTKAVAFMFSLSSKKAAELAIFRQIEQTPDRFPYPRRR